MSERQVSPAALFAQGEGCINLVSDLQDDVHHLHAMAKEQDVLLRMVLFGQACVFVSIGFLCYVIYSLSG